MDLVTIRGSESVQQPGLATVLAGGFRPFFLAAGVCAVASMAAWLGAFAGLWSLPGRWIPALWHAHEMVFGFAVAAICGFLLTAVPKWTSTPPVTGTPLAVLAAAWLLGRVAMWGGAWIPAAIVAACDLLVLPLLTAPIGRAILGAGNRRNYVFVLLLPLLFAGNALVHLDALGVLEGAATTGLYLGMDVVLLILAIVAGRIVPSFTGNALRRAGSDVVVRPRTGVGRIAVVLAAVAFSLQLAGAGPIVVGGAFVVAGTAMAIRAAGWRALTTLDQPIVWVLHAGHAFLVLGLILQGAAMLSRAFAPTVGVHALTAGAVGVMVLAVMTRASLGHSGRPLRASRTVVVAYVLVICGALGRVAAPVIAPGSVVTLVVGGALWAAGYLLFTVSHWPILTSPRVDGRPG